MFLLTASTVAALLIPLTAPAGVTAFATWSSAIISAAALTRPAIAGKLSPVAAARCARGCTRSAGNTARTRARIAGTSWTPERTTIASIRCASSRSIASIVTARPVSALPPLIAVASVSGGGFLLRPLGAEAEAL